MTSEENHRRAENKFREVVTSKEERKLKARREKRYSVWFGLGMFGLVGWSVAIPTLIGTAIGYWVDHHYPSGYSWTLMLMLLGLALGCLNAWNWIEQERNRRDDDSD